LSPSALSLCHGTLDSLITLPSVSTRRGADDFLGSGTWDHACREDRALCIHDYLHNLELVTVTLGKVWRPFHCTNENDLAFPVTWRL